MEKGNRKTMTEFYIFNNSNLKLFEGPTISTFRSREEEENAKTTRYFHERSQYCCLICGIYLELNERNEKKLCCVCIVKNTLRRDSS